MGSRPLYYVADRHRVTFASEIQQLFADPSLAREPNLPVVGEFLARTLSSLTETAFRHVMCLPGGRSLTVDDAGVHVREYWAADTTRELRYKCDEEYADHFLSLFEDVLACRVPALGPVGIFLSGGLDSCSVAVLASDLARRGRLLVERLEAFTLVFPGFSCDQRARAEQVAQAAGLPLTAVDYQASGTAYYTDFVRRTLGRFPTLRIQPCRSRCARPHAATALASS